MRVKQVHGNVVRILRKGELPEGASEQKPDGDAIVSNQPGLALAVMVADCVPILVVDPVAGAAAAIHAGWRGTCARVAARTIEIMQREFGSDPANLLAAIGPSAGPDDYEVGESLVDAFLDAGHPRADVDRWFIRSSAKPHLDLWAANRDQLIAAGLRQRHRSTSAALARSRIPTYSIRTALPANAPDAWPESSSVQTRPRLSESLIREA